MLWAYLAAAIEAEFPLDAHRHNNADRAGYLRHLNDLGYVHSDVEQLIIDNARNTTITNDAENTDRPNDSDSEEEMMPTDTA
jgi:hypothetical protein